MGRSRPQMLKNQACAWLKYRRQYELAIRSKHAHLLETMEAQLTEFRKRSF